MIKLTMAKELERYQGIPKNPQLARPEIPAIRDYVLKILGRSKSASFDITRRFFQTALREDAHQVQTLERVERNREIVRQYIETGDTLKEIGSRHDITREATRIIIRQEIVKLWLNCSKETQGLFPPECIRLRKPASVRGIRGRVSTAVSRMQAEGKSIAEIREEIGAESLKYARRRLRSWGIEVPYLRRPAVKSLKFYRELAGKLAQPNFPDVEIQKLLSRVSRYFLNIDKRQGQPSVTSVGHIISGCGFHYRRRETWHFINPLRTAGIPVGEVSRLAKSKSGEVTQRYYFIAARHMERARQALESDPNLEKYRHSHVQQVCGPQRELPTTSQLLKKMVYIPTGQVFAELGIRVAGRARIKQKDILTSGCPVPVFIYLADGQFFCRREDKETLKEFIRKSLGR